MSATQVGAVLRIPIDRVRPGQNVRGPIGDVTELAVSIAAVGLQEPLLVYDRGLGAYEVLEGHRRLAACRMAGLAHVDAIIRRDRGDASRIQQQLAMHAQRREFDPIAEAKALHELLFVHKLRRAEVSAAIGKSESWMAGRLALLNLDETQQEAVTERRLTIAEATTTAVTRRAELRGRPSAPPAAPRPPRPHCPSCQCFAEAAA